MPSNSVPVDIRPGGGSSPPLGGVSQTLPEQLSGESKRETRSAWAEDARIAARQSVNNKAISLQ